jgi:hypothetical protein
MGKFRRRMDLIIHARPHWAISAVASMSQWTPNWLPKQLRQRHNETTLAKNRTRRPIEMRIRRKIQSETRFILSILQFWGADVSAQCCRSNSRFRRRATEYGGTLVRNELNEPPSCKPPASQRLRLLVSSPCPSLLLLNKRRIRS